MLDDFMIEKEQMLYLSNLLLALLYF
jgi:hypothetical protein